MLSFDTVWNMHDNVHEAHLRFPDLALNALVGRIWSVRAVLKYSQEILQWHIQLKRADLLVDTNE